MNEIIQRTDFAKRTAISAGEILKKHFGGRQDWRIKSHRETVTDADIESEEFIIREIEREFGESILSEEFHPNTDISGAQWIIDPLDGTNNFSCGIPFFCVIIAFAVNGDTKVGVIHEPLRNETFWTDGKSSYVGDVKLNVSNTTKLDETFVATGFPYNRGHDVESNLENFVRIATICRGIRRAGSAGLDLAYTAAGQFDFYWELGLKPWDMAAGELLVRCAGGKTGMFDGKSWNIHSDRILAGNSVIFEKASKLLEDENI
ncbi:MAG TPA: inositol monophosphatase [candidate division Zixibacteria bacterium]|nr:inositol monophosphatase [candidate division Zixibacteria bacterium]